MANDNMLLKTACKLLRDARDLIEYEAQARAKRDGSTNCDVQDLRDTAEDLGPILLTLESFGG